MKMCDKQSQFERMCPIMVSRSRFFEFGLTILSIALCMSVAHAGDKPGKEDNSPVIATVNGWEIHQSEVDAAIGNQVYELEKKLYTLRKQATDDAIAKLLLGKEAARRGKTPEQLLEDIGNTAEKPDPLTVDTQFAANREALQSMGAVAGRYRVFLEAEANQRTEALRQFISELRARADIAMSLAEPVRDLHLADTKCRLGKESAPLQLVVFLDYDCPFCKKLEPFFTSLLNESEFRSRISVIIKQLPLSIHSTARAAAVAAVCAADQNKFEQFHGKLLAASDHGDKEILSLAKESGLDTLRFSACLASKNASEQVKKDLVDAGELGVDGTPAVFLDGRKLEFADPNSLRQQLQEKLAELRSTDKAGGSLGGR
jgi:protein-disulfide isomerase